MVNLVQPFTPFLQPLGVCIHLTSFLPDYPHPIEASGAVYEPVDAAFEWLVVGFRITLASAARHCTERVSVYWLTFLQARSCRPDGMKARCLSAYLDIKRTSPALWESVFDSDIVYHPVIAATATAVLQAVGRTEHEVVYDDVDTYSRHGTEMTVTWEDKIVVSSTRRSVGIYT
jgi:hypothetical protein